MTIAVKRTKKDRPLRVIVYGAAGVGKSTLAAGAPKPIFISLEDGLAHIDAVEVDPTPRTWEHVISTLEALCSSDFETVAIDSLDHLEPLCWAHVCEKGGKRILGKKEDAAVFGGAKVEHIEAFGFGKGYVAALDEWRVFLHRLDMLRVAGKHVIMIGHAVRRTVKDPSRDDYEQWTIKIHEKAAHLLTEHSDIVGFCEMDLAVDDSSGRSKVQTTGKRIMRLDANPARLSKARSAIALPPKIALGWVPLIEAVRGGDPATIVSLKERCEASIRELGDEEVETKVRSFLKERGETVPSLSEALERLEVTIAERRKAS